MKQTILFALFCLPAFMVKAQDVRYIRDINHFQRAYVDSHEVVKGPDRKYFRFFKPDMRYRVVANFRPIRDTVGFTMKTSGKIEKKFYRYGTLFFSIDKKKLQLTVYQSEKLRADPKFEDYLFIPFTDLTSGEDSYAGGRYLDYKLTDIRMGKLRLDFNRAYNPYCAYSTGYNCPIPPRENDLNIEIKAGEKMFGKEH